MDYKEKYDIIMVVDILGTGEGNVGPVAIGSSFGQTEFTKNNPVGAIVMAIVDNPDISLKEYLTKQEVE